jgi:PAS domain S-box-containing protein
VFGALVVYSADVDAFSHKEVKLLEELATDILTGLRHIRTIEENKKAETSLRKSEEQLLQAQKIAHIGSWANDFNTGEQNWSKEIYNIFELDESEVISQDTLLAIVHPEDRESLKTHQNDLLNRRKEYNMEYRLRFLDNRIKYVYEQCEIIYDAQWRPIRSLSTIQDVTKDKEMERTLIENERADTVTRTLRQVAHDFNNILQSVAGFAELARERKNDPDAVERYVKNIINGTGTLAIRVKDLQELTDPIKSTEIHHREISLNQVVRKAVSLSASTR